ncbi:conjugal transfer protein TraF [Colwelliaceae bacterium MEBiC 14330]
MKKLTTTLSLISLALCSTAHSESFTAKHAGQGFTSITHDFTSALSNPALLNKFDDDDDFYLSLNLGLAAADEYEVLDIGEAIADQIEDLDEDIDNLINVPPEELPSYITGLNQQIDNIVTDLTTVDEKPVNLRTGLNALIIIPNKYLSMGFFVNQYGRLGMSVDYTDSDESVLENAITTGNLDINDLQSSATGLGYSVAEAGAMFGYEILKHKKYDVNLGAKIKYQRLDLFYNTVNVASFDDDDFDLTDDEFLTDSDGVNVDLGLHLAFGDQRQWHVAFVANNLTKQEVSLIDQDLTFQLDMSSSVGISYQNHWLTVSGEVDLTDRASFKQLQAPKYASVGAELDWGEHVQFRLGARSDLNDTEGDLYTVGFGLSPWDVVSFDIAAFKGDNDNLGAAIQLGIKI